MQSSWYSYTPHSTNKLIKTSYSNHFQFYHSVDFIQKLMCYKQNRHYKRMSINFKWQCSKKYYFFSNFCFFFPQTTIHESWHLTGAYVNNNKNKIYIHSWKNVYWSTTKKYRPPLINKNNVKWLKIELFPGAPEKYVCILYNVLYMYKKINK